MTHLYEYTVCAESWNMMYTKSILEKHIKNSTQTGQKLKAMSFSSTRPLRSSASWSVWRPITLLIFFYSFASHCLLFGGCECNLFTFTFKEALTLRVKGKSERQSGIVPAPRSRGRGFDPWSWHLVKSHLGEQAAPCKIVFDWWYQTGIFLWMRICVCEFSWITDRS